MNHLNSRYALLLTLFLVVLPQWTRLPLWLDIVFVLSLLMACSCH
jgi:hypothetical protein